MEDPGRPAADRGRGRLGQDPGADPAHRPPHRHRGRRARGRSWPSPSPTRRPTRCAAGWPSWSDRGPSACGCRPSTRPACGSCGPTATAWATRARSPSTTTPTPGAWSRSSPASSTSTPRSSRPARCSARSARPSRRGRARPRSGPRPSRSSTGGSPTSTTSTSGGCWRPTPWTSTTCCSTPCGCSTSTPTCWSTTGTASPTSSSTSTRTPTPCQNALAVQLAGGHRNIVVVGDSDQSVYRFRGADISNILDFEQAFPDATAITLDQNFRSTQTILDAANAVITNNVSRKPKSLWTDQGGGRADRPVPGRGRARRGRVGGPRDRPAALRPGRCAGATWPSSTGPTPRARALEEAWSGPRSPTRSWGAPSSTTARRSRTSSPISGSW